MSMISIFLMLFLGILNAFITDLMDPEGENAKMASTLIISVVFSIVGGLMGSSIFGGEKYEVLFLSSEISLIAGLLERFIFQKKNNYPRQLTFF
ncbi:MAG: hypothetical protein UT63_C0060G0009 [Candidatus Gottesmanbacteria bacterium GW2011_GWC2_39_8]|uniref:Uncharacterized protein n=1 Tax=Candidatus Gottesmanbacteria bacterium GW2011_GWC2_39_8 TaxID=1618450 RepID=A0A0G0Q353_9BACT|nr:MAG: hypothetical protein UT63_C0060G0009 [Candidatus Gottesmanbacteria bacterium GW2011_GWC2_39_8]